MTRWTRRGLIIGLAVTVCMVIGGAQVFADNTVTVTVTGMHQQTEARTMLDMVNDFRTGKSIDGGQTAVWARAENGSIDTASYTNLGTLQYDYELEKVAMERAMDLILQFDHERPNTTPDSGVRSWSTLYPNDYETKGENIYMSYGGRGSAQNAFDSWCETTEPYSGQGHRRNMLGRGYNRIGVACVKVHWEGELTEGDIPYDYSTDVYFWVQEFGSRSDSFGLTPTPANDSEGTQDIDVLKSNIKSAGIEATAESVSCPAGGEKEFTEATSTLILNKTRPESFNLTWSGPGYDGKTSKGPYYVPVSGAFTLSSGDTQIATAEGNRITGHKAGETTLTVTSQLDPTKSVQIPLTVEGISLSGAEVNVSPSSLEYTGQALIPAVTVTLNGQPLNGDTDYTVAYKDNISAGTATVTVTGKGDYSGEVTGSFTITPMSIFGAEVNVSPSSLEYTGQALTPKPEVTLNGQSLTADTDYTVSYSNNERVGTAMVTVKGEGNYTGEVMANFTITQKALTTDNVTLDPATATYTGSLQKPEVKVTDGEKLLIEGTDYTLTNEGGTNAGTYDVIVTGKGNEYTGEVKLSFVIKEKSSGGGTPGGGSTTPTVNPTPANQEIVDLPTVKIGSVKKAKKSFTVKWKKPKKKNLKKIAKIQVQYSLTRDFSAPVTKTVKKTKTSLKVKGLQSGTTYYVQVRAYKDIGGVKHVSRWSTIKKVKVK